MGRPFSCLPQIIDVLIRVEGQGKGPGEGARGQGQGAGAAEGEGSWAGGERYYIDG